ncbi:hypothetical protein SKAU_G00021090 [Synaphobranchus kaupii]|uniref:Uncharacterized protein n=1 Tax=Synaphobranchus kaupii TaxID=118154 RepID=A0A9Q1GBT3_SYNKA|nr:hypothetical protein SKAU_G00021090 [Synaphobranchus kaupii]
MDIDQAPEPEEGIGNAHDNEVPDPYPWRSFTEAALSLFFETSGISEATFSSLLEIISHESFKKEDIPPNVSALKVTALDIIKINIDRRSRLARVESIAFDSSIQDLVLRAASKRTTHRCRICTVDKADLSNPQVASEAPRRTKANTNIIIAGMSEMGVVEWKRQETETGTLFSQNNQLFSDDIVIEPHIQTRIDHFHQDALGVGRLQISLIWGNIKTQLQQFLSDLIVAIDRPHWLKQLPDVYHLACATGCEVLHLIQMWPIIARDVMCCPEAFTAASVEYIGRNTCRLVTKANILLSGYLSLIRSASLTDDEARQHQVEICDHHKLFERIWKADVANRANIHGYHTREQTDVLVHPMIGDCNCFE